MSQNSNQLLTLLQNAGLSPEKQPSPAEWRDFIERVHMLLESSEKEKDQFAQVLDLGYQEMQKMWDLIQQRESLTKAIFDSSQDIILILNDRGQIVEFNLAFQKAFGLPHSEIMGRELFSFPVQGSLMDLLRNFFHEPSQRVFNDLLASKKELSLKISNDEEMIVLLHASWVQKDQTTLFPLYIRDLTAEKRAQQELEKSRAQLMVASKMSALGEMAGGIAHEINTPLAIIQMRADQIRSLAERKKFDENLMEKALDGIDSTVSRISKIITGLRAFAHGGQGEAMKLTSIAQIIEDTFSFCREKFISHGILLSYHAKEDALVECRTEEISQVLLNLLNNAFDAVESLNEKWVKVELDQTQNDSIRLSVTDSGPRIPPEIQEKMMQPFFTTKELGKGTGLGLSISQGILQGHGGTLSIDNSVPHARLALTLPKLRKRSKIA